MEIYISLLYVAMVTEKSTKKVLKYKCKMYVNTNVITVNDKKLIVNFNMLTQYKNAYIVKINKIRYKINTIYWNNAYN